MALVYEHRTTRIGPDGCLLHTRSDIPHYGILEICQGLYILVVVNGSALNPLRLSESKQWILTVPSLDAGWQELQTTTL